MISHFTHFVNGGRNFMLQKRVNLFGLWVDDISLGEAEERVQSVFHGSGAISVVTPNLEILHGARMSAGARAALNSADLSLPDGVGISIVAYLLGQRIENRVAGIDFGERLLALCEKEGKSVYLLGGRDGVAEKAANNLLRKHKNLKICGTHNGFFDDSEFGRICSQINVCAPDVLLVCRGFPRQEKFVMLSRSALPTVKVFACLGGSLDVWAGDIERAPETFRKCGLEWLWRIACEPERARKFALSLTTLALALKMYLENCFAPEGIKYKKRAYNQVNK